MKYLFVVLLFLQIHNCTYSKTYSKILEMLDVVHVLIIVI